MDASSFVVDASVVALAFTCTGIIHKSTRSFLSSQLSNWDSVKPETQNRMSCEIALLPSRLAMLFCCLPIILNSFRPINTWLPSDTMRSILACAIMAGSYTFDLTIERADVLSLIHHCFGPAMLLWIRCSFSSFEPSDAHMCRIIISFVFFGAACGGTFTTAILVIMKLMKSYLTSKQVYAIVSKLVWSLTINTFLATTFGSLYMLTWFDDLFGYWGCYAFLPLLLSGFEYYLQWRWAFRFQNIQDDLHTKSLAVGIEKKTEAIVSKSVKTKDILLRFIVGVWLVSYVSIYAKVANKAAMEIFSLKAL